MVVEILGSAWFSHLVDVNAEDFVERNLSLLWHERTHVRQQKRWGTAYWYWKYITSKSFRLEAEAEAYAVELLYIPEVYQEASIEMFASWLAGSMYSHCAKNELWAEASLRSWINKVKDRRVH